MPSVDTARAILSALDDLGLTHILYCPGSRSAPFAYALESGAFGGHAMPVLDERGAGFAAVGLARTGALPAVIVTSGTAVAELTPAVLEASHARLPLLVMSADRPGELRGVGASQATFQSGLFGVHARACVDLEPQEPSRALVGQLSRAVAAACGAPTGTPGPVQINVAFRDPLTPQSRASGAAGGGVTPYEQAIVSSPLAGEVDTVVVTGRPTLSRPIHALLARPDVRVVVVDAHAPWVDISGNASVVVPALAAPLRPTCGAEWAARVRAAADEVGLRIDALLAAGSGRTMLFLARAVASATRGPLVLGASNPVRAFDLAVESLAGRPVFSNRGQAGIDGTIAAAVGIAAGLGSARIATPGRAGEPRDDARGRAQASRVTAVMGDLTLCHDASSLALAAATGAELDIIVADDEGGGIFATLEHGNAATPEAYDRWFGVAQHVNYEALAAAYGVGFARAATPSELASVLADPPAGPRLIHAPVERAAHLYAQARNALNAS